MPRRKSNGTTVPKADRPTASEMEQWYQANQYKLKKYEDADEAFKRLKDLNKAKIFKIKTFDKETLRTYLENISNYEKDIRNLSWFLYNRSMAYKR
jgi:hypothetical protein